MNLWQWIGGFCVVFGVAVGAVVGGWLGLAAAAILVVVGACGLTHKEKDIAVRLGGLVWTIRDFARGLLITGDIGSGKTSSGIVQLMRQIFRNVPTWGGLCIDEKGVFWETLAGMAAHFERTSDVVVYWFSVKRRKVENANALLPRVFV